MTVSFEFLCDEPSDNVATYLHYKFDRVVYFGYKNVIEERKKTTERFLKQYCEVDSVKFCELPAQNLQEVLSFMREAIDEELIAGNDIYFDITGGESLILVAFGILSKEYDAPMHLFDVREQKIIELEEGASRSLCERIPKRDVDITIEMFIEMRGGSVNYDIHNPLKDDESLGDFEDIEKVWFVAKKHWEEWRGFDKVMKQLMEISNGLTVDIYASRLMNLIRAYSNKKIKRLDTFYAILKDLYKVGVITYLEHMGEHYRFTIKNSSIEDALTDRGRLLEVYMYLKICSDYDDCGIGIHLDWDGIVKKEIYLNVFNEVDVVALDGMVPSFFSCKTGNLESVDALRALYEIETVANRFGGKYCKRYLVTAVPLGITHRLRAKEMGIELIVV